MQDYKCNYCGKKFQDFPSNKRSTCSLKCRNKKYSKERKGKSPIRIPVGYKRKPFTIQHRIRLSEAKKLSPSPAQFTKGHHRSDREKHPNWKGGITPETQRLRLSRESKDWRKKVFERDNYTCQMCGIRGGYLEADHIKSWSKYPKLRWVVSNGRTLCKPCHKQTSNWGRKR